MKSNIVSLVVCLISALVMIFLQQKGMSLREDERSKDLGVSYLQRSKMPTAGFDAVAADFIWMRTNLKPQPKAKKDISDEEKKAFQKRIAERLFVGYSKVVALDPTFKKAYDFSILRIMSDLPDKGIALAELAMLYVDGGKKEFAELAGHIASTVLKDHRKALGYYEICVEGAPEKDYLGRRYLRTILRTKGIDPYEKSMKGLFTRISEYDKKWNQVKSKLEETNSGEDEGQGDSGMGLEGQHWIQEIVLDRIRTFMDRALEEKVDSTMMKKVEGIYASYAPSGHNCSRCYQPYEAGDNFCFNCGLELEVYGACKRDGVVLRGDFCHECGLGKGEAP
jgi:hypothetical protein